MLREGEATADGNYVERLRWVGSDWYRALFCLVLTFMGVQAFRAGAGSTVVVVAALGAGLVLPRVIRLASRRVMLRVDRLGVALGTPSLWTERTEVVPWGEVAAVILWRQWGGPGAMRYIGLERGSGPGTPSPAMGRFARRATWFFSNGARHPPVTYHDSRAVWSWSVDHDQLTAAISRFAPPHVRVDDNW